MAEVKRGSPLWEKAAIAAYGIVCLLFFIYIRFPFDIFRGRLEQAISTTINQPVTLGRIHSRFPCGFKVDGVSINKTPFTKELILYPHVFSLMTGKMGLDMKALLPSGSIAFSFDTPLSKARKSVNASVKMENFDSGLFKTLFGTSAQMRGVISGDMTFYGPSPSFKDMGGNIRLTWKDGYIPVSDMQMPVDSLQFKTMVLDSRMNQGLLTLDKFELKGNVSGNIKGAVRMMDPFRRSRLNLTGEIMLPPGMVPPAAPGQGFSPQGSYKFSLRGTVDRPRFRLLGSAI